MKKYDAIVVGGGHNGLICAAYLAKAGRKVLVLEKKHLLGGATVTEEYFPGFKFSVCSYVVSLLRPTILRELELPKHGLEIIPLDASFTPYPDGRSLLRTSDGEMNRREISKFSARDAEIAPEFGQAMVRIAKFVKPIIDTVAPDPTSLHPNEIWKLLKLAKRFSSLSEEDLITAFKILTMSAADFLDEWFEADELKAPMSCSGVIGTFLGVRSPGTAYVMLHHYMGELDGNFRSWGFAKGGTGAIAEAIASAARKFGTEIRVNAGVEKVIVKNDRAVGVALESGEEIYADKIISGLDPNRTFLKLVDEKHLDSDTLTRIKHYKLRGSSGKVNLALDRLPEFKSRPGNGVHLSGDIMIAPSINYIERAYDDAKYGGFSKRPVIDMVLLSMLDPSMAPPGKHVMSCFVQFANYKLKEGAAAWENKRDEFGKNVIDTIEEYIPNIRDIILYKQVLTPWDLEKDFGLTEGNIFHGELGLEQLLFMRPISGITHYQTSIPNLWMCGSGTHPGGGIMGGPGWLAAKEILKA